MTDQTTQQNSPQSKRQTAKPTAAVLAAAALAATFAAPLTMQSEGVKTDHQGNAVSYIDHLGRGDPPTICFGNTGLVRAPDGTLVRVTIGMKFPMSHCKTLLHDREEQDAIPIWRVTPGIAQYPRCWGQMIDFTHNFNVGVYAHSSIASNFNRNQWVAGANAILLYNKSKGVVLRGLTTRREHERAECIKDFNGAKEWLQPSQQHPTPPPHTPGTSATASTPAPSTSRPAPSRKPPSPATSQPSAAGKASTTPGTTSQSRSGWSWFWSRIRAIV